MIFLTTKNNNVMKQEIINALSDYEGTDFFVNDALIKFIEDTPAASPVPETGDKDFEKEVDELEKELWKEPTGAPVSTIEGDKRELFTKGEWRSTEWLEITVSKPGIVEGSKRICQVSDFSKEPGEAEANARLCAAAPLLLKELKEAMNIIDRLDELYRDATGRHSTFTKGEFNRLNSAIQKATQG